jgi:uncharacterized lipoprotein YmbA
MHRRLLPAAGTVLCASLTLLTGCLGVQQPSRFYILNTSPGAERPSPGVPAESGPAIGLGPLTVPRYVDRPQIVTRTSPYELHFAEFDRWAEPLEIDVLRAMAEELSRQIPTDHIALFPWPPGTLIDYQVTVGVTEFYVQTEGQSSLVALWSISKPEGKEALISRKSRFRAPASTRDYAVMVAAMSQTVADLSREIAAALKTLAVQANIRQASGDRPAGLP